MMSDQINELAAALCKAQAEIKNAPQSKINPHFRSKYADLATIRDAATPALSKYGLAVSQASFIAKSPDGMPSYVVWRTILMHTSGQYIISDYPIPYMPEKPQVMGSHTTYARRYTYAAIIVIASEEDDDANAAQDVRNEKSNGRPAEIRMSPEQSADVCQAMLEQIEELESVQAVDDYAKEHAGLYGRLSAQHQETIKKATNKRRVAVSEGDTR